MSLTPEALRRIPQSPMLPLRHYGIQKANCLQAQPLSCKIASGPLRATHSSLLLRRACRPAGRGRADDGTGSAPC